MESKKYQGIAPGRLDVMGGIADYSGSMVLQMPIDQFTKVTMSPRSDLMVNIRSGQLLQSLDMTPLLKDRGRITEKRNYEQANLSQWSLYVFGCLFVMLDEFLFEFHGLDIYIESKVPLGSGLSSSAALEISTLRSFCQLFKLDVEPIDLAVLAQKAENDVAGAACGIMDQIAVHMGTQGHLLPIICQPHEVLTPIPLPESLNFIGINTGVKHSVAGSTYNQVRTSAFMGHHIISQHRNISYLCELTYKEFNSQFVDLLPESISGKSFIENYGEISDPYSNILLDQVYEVRKCTAHPIAENERVRRFKDLITGSNIDLEQLGKLMYESHRSYSEIGLSCPEADFLIEKAMAMGIGREIYGGRITGGGSGGTVCLLTGKEADITSLVEDYENHFNHKTHLLVGESIVSAKSRLRNKMKKLRNQFPNGIKKEEDRWLQTQILQRIDNDHLKVVHSFLPMNGEVDLMRLLSILLERKITIVCPKTEKDGQLTHLVLEHPDQVEIGFYNTTHPASGKLYEGPYDLILVPGLAFDEHGNRLGYGGGYYDRFLEQNQDTFKLGVAHSFQMIDHVPHEEHDVNLDDVVYFNAL